MQTTNLVIPAQAGIQSKYKTRVADKFACSPAAQGLFFLSGFRPASE